LYFFVQIIEFNIFLRFHPYLYPIIDPVFSYYFGILQFFLIAASSILVMISFVALILTQILN